MEQELTVGWINRDYETNRIISKSKIHLMANNYDEVTLCGCRVPTMQEAEVDDGSMNDSQCVKCHLKADKMK